MSWRFSGTLASDPIGMEDGSARLAVMGAQASPVSYVYVPASLAIGVACSMRKGDLVDLEGRFLQRDDGSMLLVLSGHSIVDPAPATLAEPERDYLRILGFSLRAKGAAGRDT